MKKFTLQAILLIAAIALALFLFKINPDVSDLPFLPQPTVTKTLEIGSAKLKVEIADTQEKRSKGLSGKQGLGQDEGMLFLFPVVGKYPFWMKGLTFPLDFVWIKGDKVVDILQNVPPPAPGQTDAALPVYQSKEDIDQVLEVNSGTVQRLNIKVGDMIKII